ncbi:MAG: HPr(Ser) kinase/phosphatase [Syntrophorhabdales bacterium]|jgi:HPr kinase/phosphorylase
MKRITVEQIARDSEYGLELEVISGSRGLSRKIYNPRIQKLGLVIAGYMVYLHPHRVQILGYTEISYLRGLEPEAGEKIVADLCSRDVACFVVTRNLKVPEYLLRETEVRQIPLLRTRLVTARFIERVTHFLGEMLAPTGTVHGVLMAIMGVGVLIIGRSGIGKSENALDLVMRGHRLVSDDIVEVKKTGTLDLMGQAPEMLRNLLEIRGIGIVDIRQLFGVSAVRPSQRLELVVELLDWDNSVEYERVGLREEKYRFLGIELPLMRIPISPGRNASAIIELACRNHLLKKEGINTAGDLEQRVLRLTGPKEAKE